ncbi:MAG TPA: hypothetical protein VKT78_18700 [Fimbriimonadaceae bacterium]|nr:hypothetical protein [Fimbriimonadaceae bacterium]
MTDHELEHAMPSGYPTCLIHWQADGQFLHLRFFGEEWSSTTTKVQYHVDSKTMHMHLYDGFLGARPGDYFDITRVKVKPSTKAGVQ